jgi:hypothetical protein
MAVSSRYSSSLTITVRSVQHVSGRAKDVHLGQIPRELDLENTFHFLNETVTFASVLLARL